jgi:hypothetical protein
MTPRSARSAIALFVAALAMLPCSGAWPAPVPASAPRAPAQAASHREEGVRWQSLTPAQRSALAPLEREWPTIDAARKQKWLVIAGRFKTLPPLEQARISDRMTEWARLTPAERGEARLRYQEARQVPESDRSARWEAYQKLPPNEKQQLAARAAASIAVPPAAPKRDAGGRESTQAKTNIVSNPALAQPPRPVTPTVVQASRGATTHLITRPSSPPPHQQTGMPKIAATPEFVNRSTLLPRRGPQAAAVTPVTASTRPYAPPPLQPAAPVGPAKVAEPTPPR